MVNKQTNKVFLSNLLLRLPLPHLHLNLISENPMCHLLNPVLVSLSVMVSYSSVLFGCINTALS